MELELHQLDLRYEALRTRRPRREQRLLASLAEIGQQTPIVVVAGQAAEPYVVVDGYKRVRALRKLGHDLVAYTRWELGEADALVFERLLRGGEADSPMEQGWLLRELVARFGLYAEELARRFDRSPSWVSRRLALVGELPDAVQSLVQKGAIGAHGAMKYLVPMARANRADCTQLAEAIAPLAITSRQLGELYATYQGGEGKTRELVLEDPDLVLRAKREARCANSKEQSPAELLLADLEILGSVARRARRRFRQDGQALSLQERAELRRCAVSSWADLASLWRHLEKELIDARPEHPKRDPQAA